MSRATTEASNSVADLISYRNTLVRTGKFVPLGRVKQIAIAPAKGWAPKMGDPLIARYGRFMQFNKRTLMLGQSEDRSQILVINPMLKEGGYPGLEDWPVPDWKQPEATKDEMEGVLKTRADGTKYREFPQFDPARREAPLMPQDLRDRAEGMVEGTEFLAFSPVVSVTFQPDLGDRMEATVWVIAWEYNAADNTHPTLLVNERTGETHFYGGRYDIQRPRGD